MMVSKKIIFLLLIFSSAKLFAQELVSFYDREKQKYGFQNKETGQIVIEPQFEFALEWWKDFGIVSINGKYGLIDRNGNKVTPFVHNRIRTELSSDGTQKELVGIYSYANYYHPSMGQLRKFYLNEKCDCVPRPFYPCPPMIPMDTSLTPMNLKLIQRAEYWFHQGEVKKALEIGEKAIEADTNEASTWYWKAVILADGWNIPISESPKNFEMNYKYECEYNQKSIENDKLFLENRKAGLTKPPITGEEFISEMKLLQIEDSLLKIHCEKRERSKDSLNVIYTRWQEQSMDFWNSNYDTSIHLKKYYDAVIRHSSKESLHYYSALAGKYDLEFLDKTEKKKIKKEITSGLDRKYRKAETNIMLSAGYAFFPYQKWEIDVSYSLASILSKKEPFLNFIAAGIGYEQSLESDLSIFKIFVMQQPLGPVHYGFHLLIADGFGNSDLGFRPEFGFSFSVFTILYGYNFISNSKFPGARGNMVGMRLHFPVWRKNDFTKAKEAGSNLYR